MATLVLTALGSALGGPVGGAVGALLGQQLDLAVIGPGPRREGPRLKELELQTSSYGSLIPAVFGVMRVAGTVIWASDLIEQRTASGGSKSRPGTTTYSYSANLAVAVSSVPIVRIGRIWADGNLLRGADGDLKVEAELRVHDGWDDGEVDPLMAASEGAALSPAHRGLAYVVFEGLQLADFGNRIPSLTFEVFERDGPVRVDELLSRASGGVITGAVDETVDGYALQGSDQRASIAPLIDSFPLTLRPENGRLRLDGWFGAADSMSGENIVANVDGKAIERPVRMRGAKDKAPIAFALRHYEPARDYQAGLQRYGLSSYAGHDIQFDLPATLAAAKAQRLAALIGLQKLASGARSNATLAYSADIPKLASRHAGDGHKITEIEYLKGCMRVSRSGWIMHQAVPDLPVDAGRDVTAPDLAIGQTLLELVDLPALSAPMPAQPRLGVIAGGTGQGWRRAALFLQEGMSRIEIGRTAVPGNIATLLSPFAAHPSHLIDRTSRPVIRVAHQGMDFLPGDGDPLSASAPVAHVAGEFVKYGNCEQIGPTEFRLSELVRGCFGTEHKVAAHAVGTQIALMVEEETAVFDALGLAVDGAASIEAIGLGDAAPVNGNLDTVGLAVRPLPPVHLNIYRDGLQNLHLSWRRRSRLDNGWRDHVDLPLDEPQLTFDVQIAADGQFIAHFQTTDEALEIAAAVVAGWSRPLGTELDCLVRQIGAGAVSAPCTGRFIV